MNRVMCLLLVVGLAAGCGGGGGGAMTRLPDTPVMPPMADLNTQTAFQGTLDQAQAILTQVARTEDLVRRTNLHSGPVFGSVLQTRRSAGIAEASGVETTWSTVRNRFALTVTRAAGSPLTVDTTRDPTGLIQEYTPETNPVTNRPAIEGVSGRTQGSAVVLGAASIEWSRTDPTDYLAGGYWLYADASTNDAEIGAFIDGPAFDDVALTLPATGTATYDGRAGGVYIGVGGSDTSSPGATEAGQYRGRVQLMADFGAEQISGRLYDISRFTVAGREPNGQVYFLDELAGTGYEAHLNPVPIGSNGSFAGSGVHVTHPALTITASEGSWGGRFSNVADADGNPRAVAGTNSVMFETAGGTEAVLTGAFYGATERFE